MLSRHFQCQTCHIRAEPVPAPISEIQPISAKIHFIVPKLVVIFLEIQLSNDIVCIYAYGGNEICIHVMLQQTMTIYYLQFTYLFSQELHFLELLQIKVVSFAKWSYFFYDPQTS